MKIIGETIHFNSSPFFYKKELSGNKNNTIRRIPFCDFYELSKDILFICIHSSVHGYYFQRKLTDISYYDGNFIFSW